MEVDNVGGGGVERNYESLRHWTPSGGVMDAGREQEEGAGNKKRRAGG